MLLLLLPPPPLLLLLLLLLLLWSMQLISMGAPLCIISHCHVVELLLAASPTLLDVVDKDGCTALLYAVKRRHEAIVNRLLALNPKNLEAGADDADADGGTSSSSSSNSMNVFHHAISQGNQALGWRLLGMRPDLIYKPSRHGFTPLSMAMCYSFVFKLFAPIPRKPPRH